ncbi:chemotaxis protein CheA [Ornithinibacillus bavariensis]|uniref:Chemotaxis protein CheA n=1 Tax=Ornithinibacillus bavariensis TaxID=545502 RepID=A0A919XAH6_9BACI|nr:chemotaxis protein CheA [Ornithinibacillus bavariensis]GIO27033.1 chemotaxis protein CheA [Ornithinibacillus bavariensis]
MDTDQYLEVFLDESREHLQAINDNLLRLENEPTEIDIVQEIFRSAHTLKGMSATMGYEDIASLTHQMENVLDKIRHHELEVSTKVIDITFSAIGALEEMVQSVSDGNDGKKDVTALVSQLQELENGKVATTEVSLEKGEELPSLSIQLDEYQSTVISQAISSGYHPYQITVQLNEDCVLKGPRAYMVFDNLEKIGEVIKTNPEVEEIEEGNFENTFTLLFITSESKETVKKTIERVSEIHHVELQDVSLEKKTEKKENETTQSSEKGKQAEQNKPKHSKTIRVNIERIDGLMNLFEEVIIDRSRLEDISHRYHDQELRETVENLARVTENMQGMMLAMRMVPIEQVFNRFPRMVRDLSKELHKKIALEIEGSETELDRTVIDEIGDPLVHLIRNSLDHGIELPEARKQSGKSEEGRISLKAYHSGNHVFIDIEDDGAGINREKVEAKAIENGLVSPENSKHLTDEEVYHLIFASGFSTADQISDISGRGVGLDVVRNKIESLGGSIEVKSVPGKGSKFSIQLPLTLSILSTLLVNVGNEKFAIPLSSIIETVALGDKDIKYVHGQKVLDFRGHIVPLVSLQEVYGVSGQSEASNSAVIIQKGDKQAGLLVDSFLGQREIVLKSLGNYLKNVFAISGATILGNGEVCLIVDPNALVK